MKTILQILVGSLAISSAVEAAMPGSGSFSVTEGLLTAARPALRYQSEIVRMTLAPEFPDQTINSGHVVLDLEERLVRLVLFTKKSCATSFYCSLEMPSMTVIELPLVNKTKDSCGNSHFVSRADKRPVDGNLQEIEIVDYRKNQCPTFVALPDVSIAYRVVTSGRGTGGSITSVSSFDGTALRRIQ